MSREVNNLLRDRFKVYFSTTQIEEYCLAVEEGAAEIDVTRPKAKSRQAVRARPEEGSAQHEH